MARGINKVILIGHLGQDPEARYTPTGTAVVTVSIATSDSWKDRQTGETQDRTEWHRVVFFSRLAEIVAQYLHKGSKIYVEGSLRTRKWQDKNGQDRFTTEVVANEMQMLDAKSDSINFEAPSNNHAANNNNDSSNRGGNGFSDLNSSALPLNADTQITDEDVPF